MQRRFFLMTAAAATLGGCGFKLRQAPDFAFSTLYLTAAESSPLANELRRNLESTGKVKVLREAKDLNNADVILDLLQELRDRVVVATNSSGQVRELQLRLRVTFRLRTPTGGEPIPSTEIIQQRDISYNESQALAKEGEEALLYRNMQSDIVQQMLRRLAAVKQI